MALRFTKTPLNKEENLTSQILTIIINFIEKHPEIWEEVNLTIKPGKSMTFRFFQDGEEYKVNAKVIGFSNDTIDLEFEKKLKFKLQILNKN